MPHTLKNKNIEIQIDLPFENYCLSRFDWTGKIVGVKFQNIQLDSVERIDSVNKNHFGKGFYNEFGIDTALGYDDAQIGGWFHKIGVGLLKKDDLKYVFNKPYAIKPAEFKTVSEGDKIVIICKSDAISGYSYLLRKEIELHQSGFAIKYYLENTGEKDILTDEYVHNFTAINKDPVGANYILNFPFLLKPEFFGETVNPEQKVSIEPNTVEFYGTPKQDFFFSNLTGGEMVKAEWELVNLKNKIGIRETGSFKTNKVNLWGWGHVVSPELFFRVHLKPGKSIEWSRNFTVHKMN